MNRLLILFLVVAGMANAQFAPAPGFPGSTAIHKDSSVFVNWASGNTVTRGPRNIQNPGLGLVTFGVESDALGIADVVPVSLGDGGEAVLTFPKPIMNGSGPDFAVFENGFANDYLELAFVEVSSDGMNFFRFDAISTVQTDVQLTNFSFSDCSSVYNLAGKYRQNYGTPFDLDQLAGISGLNTNAITHVKLIDVVGSIDPQYGTYDSQGVIINDPYPTEFDSGGFDLDAVGVIHENQTGGIGEKSLVTNVYPNPFQSEFQCVIANECRVIVRNIHGQIVLSREESANFSVDLSEHPNGVYFLHLESGSQVETIRLIKQ